ncbi:MAG TPA: aspartyl protease family protein, partial [Candidatus Cybelea sp.]
DYRTVEGVVLPFSISGDGDDFTVARYALLRRVRSADFARPAVPDNARMLGGTVSSTVPITLDGRQLLVWASIDGRAPMPFILDTGGHAIQTRLAAKTLGVRASGAGSSGGAGAGTVSTAYTRVKSLRIGQAELLDQPMLIIPYPYEFYERAHKTPVAGIIGLEFFERYATRIDYGDRTVTFTPLRAYRYRGHGDAVPFTFETDPDLPMVAAAADGHLGLFGVDTGNAGHLILFGAYLDRTGLARGYASGPLVIGHATGGTNTSYLAKLREFTVGDRHVYDIETGFTHMKAGSFAAWTQAGNFGFSVLSRFIPTFDYANERLYLDSQRRATPFWENRSGISFEKNGPSAFDVIAVQPRSAAAGLGIVAGDRILAVNGRAVEYISGGDLTHLFGAAAGTNVRLRVAHQKDVRDIVLVLLH